MVAVVVPPPPTVPPVLLTPPEPTVPPVLLTPPEPAVPPDDPEDPANGFAPPAPPAAPPEDGGVVVAPPAPPDGTVLVPPALGVLTVPGRTALGSGPQATMKRAAETTTNRRMANRQHFLL